MNEALFNYSATVMEADASLLTGSHSNHEKAFAALVRAADRGHPPSQHRLSAIYGTGVSLGGRYLVPMDAGRSLSLEYMAALGGSQEAMAGMGYRYLYGIGVMESCEMALPFLEFAANAAAEFLSSPNQLGIAQYQDRTLLSSLVESSLTDYLLEQTGLGPLMRRLNLKLKGGKNGGDSSGKKSFSAPSLSGGRQEMTEEWADYYAHLAENGDAFAASALGTLYSYGSRLVSPDLKKAKHFLSLGAKTKSPEASGQLGYLLAREYEAMRREGRLLEGNASTSTHNPTHIHALLNAASKKGDPNGAVGLGYVYYKGIGAEVNLTRALNYFYSKLTHHPDAGFYIGEINMGVTGDGPNRNPNSNPNQRQQHVNLPAAMQSYTVSAHLGNYLSMHKLGHMHHRAQGVPSRSCPTAAQYFRSVAERGEWAMALNRASKLYAEGHRAAALFEYSQLAVTGVEAAQFNAAYLLSHSKEGAGIESTCPPLAVTRVENATSTLTSASASSPQHRVNFKPENIASPNLPAPISDEKSTKEKKAGEGKDVSLLDLPSNKAAYLNPAASNTSLARTESSRNGGSGSWTARQNACDARAMLQFGLSAAQNNAEALLALGDFHYYRRGGLPLNRAEASYDYRNKINAVTFLFLLGCPVLQESRRSTSLCARCVQPWTHARTGRWSSARLPSGQALLRPGCRDRQQGQDSQRPGPVHAGGELHTAFFIPIRF